jgi:succinylarginine dihydrolase
VLYSSSIQLLLLHGKTERDIQIPKRYPEAVNTRRTDNALAKRKMLKGQIKIFKTIYRIRNIGHHESHKNMVASSSDTKE